MVVSVLNRLDLIWGPAIILITLSVLGTGVLCLLSDFLKKRNLGHGPLTQPQRVHDGTVPRVGGLSVFLCVLVASFFLFNTDDLYLLMLCFIPAFVAGFFEDLFGKIQPLIRLVSIVLSACLAVSIADARIVSVELVWVDAALGFFIVSSVLSVLAIATLANAMNIIDGMNGLATGTALILLLAIFVISGRSPENFVALSSLFFACVLIGFLPYNFPFAKIFLGDGGAYLIGASIGSLLILLPKSIDNVSPFVSLLLVSYPFYELVRTIFRRLYSSSQIMAPDRGHLHTLLFRYLVLSLLIDRRVANPLSSILVLIFPLFSALISVQFSQDSSVLICSVCLVILSYEFVAFLVQKKIKSSY